jgi:prevent-host-death family protein
MYTVTVAKKYSIAEARSQLPTIVDEAEAGVEVELTRHGRPVAVVVSHREFERLQGRRLHFGDAYRRFLQTHRLGEIGTVRDHSRRLRDRSSGRKVSL